MGAEKPDDKEVPVLRRRKSMTCVDLPTLKAIHTRLSHLVNIAESNRTFDQLFPGGKKELIIAHQAIGRCIRQFQKPSERH